MNKILSNPLVLILAGIFFILFFVSLKQNAEKTAISTQSIQELETDIATLKNDIDLSQEKLNDAQSPLNQEKILRNELLLQKEGEIILQIPDIEEKKETTPSPTPAPLEEWKKLLLLF
jgi:cell division protein FtsB